MPALDVRPLRKQLWSYQTHQNVVELVTPARPKKEGQSDARQLIRLLSLRPRAHVRK
jgi:hypothetical protein